jgi:zinc protease
MVLTITGDINTDEVIQEVKNKFSTFKRMEPKLPKLSTPKIPDEKNEILSSIKREQSLVIVGFPSVKLTDNEKYIFEVIDSLMSGSNGRMFSNIRDKIGMAYALGSVFQPGLEPGYHIFYALTSRQNIDIIKDAIINEIKELKDKTVPDEEFEAAKRYLITSTMADLQRNKAFSLKISLDELYGLGYRDFETYNARINSVTPSQVKRVANQYFDLKKCLIIVIYGEGGEAKAF